MDCIVLSVLQGGTLMRATPTLPVPAPHCPCQFYLSLWCQDIEFTDPFIQTRKVMRIKEGIYTPPQHEEEDFHPLFHQLFTLCSKQQLPYMMDG